ncbi:MAG: hypothetical protein QM715_03935 [Nibricoccus sp.]
MLLARAAGCFGHSAPDPSDDELLERLEESVRWENVVVYMEWLSPADWPIKADRQSDRWWLVPKVRFQQTVMRKQALPKDVKPLLDQWFPIEPYDETETGPRLAGLKRYSWQQTAGGAGREFDFTKITHAELVGWAKQAIEKGEIAVYEELAKFTMRAATEEKPLTAAEYEAAAKEYAQKYEIDLGSAKSENSLEKIPKKSPDAPQTYKTPTTDKPEALPNEVDDTCPAHNCRSESTDSADQEVKDWFGSAENLKNNGDWTLGNKGGGGFLTSTTRVVQLPEPRKLWRYCGGDSLESGGWWSLTPLEGDPRVENALFPVEANEPTSKGGTGEKLVSCEINKPTKVLMGIGAPRCSNKPGGPVQVCLPYKSVGDDPNANASLIK